MRAARYLGPGARHLVLVAVTFDNLQNYTALVRKTTIDASLYRLDLALFGVEPTVWMRRFYHPLLTDWMASCYAIFLVTPMFLAIALSWRGRREDFREIVQAVMLQMWSAFFIFICLRRDHRAISSRCARAADSRVARGRSFSSPA